ncbi:FAD-dependent oxidoreductase [Kineococcus esterisolvens]|uniref:FAD-dependent oxidoreductase n=1 Tax=Kineococcus sp. SYSU DK013 TaxID=3383134 RepID=UPI003D7EB1E9
MSAPTLVRQEAGTGAGLPVVVAGAGSRGLAAAEALLDAGLEVVLVETADAVGGLARSVQLWGLPHSLSSPGLAVNAAPQVVAQWLDLSGGHVERTRARHALAPHGHRPRVPRRGPEVLSPVAGTGALWAELARRLRARGALVLTGATATGLHVQDGRVAAVRVQDATGEHLLACRGVVDALPTHRRLLPPGVVAVTSSRDAHLVHLLVEAPDGAVVGPRAHDVTAAAPGPRVRRLTSARAWRPRTLASARGAVLRAELAAPGDELSGADDAALRRLVLAELPALGVPAPVRVLDDAVLRLPASLPLAVEEAGGAALAGLVRVEDGPVPGRAAGLRAAGPGV